MTQRVATGCIVQFHFTSRCLTSAIVIVSLIELSAILTEQNTIIIASQRLTLFYAALSN